MSNPAYVKFPMIKKNVKDANGRCGHNMIPQYCALCNPVNWTKRQKQRKKPDRRRLTSRFILLVIDNNDGVEVARFWDDELDAAKAARDEINEVMDDKKASSVKIIDNPEYVEK